MDDSIRILYLVDTLDDPSRDLLPHLKRLTRNLDQAQFKIRVMVVRGDDPEFDSQSLLCPVDRLDITGTDPVSVAVTRLKLYNRLRTEDDEIICAYGWAARAVGLPVARRVSSALRLSVVRDMGYGIGPRALRALQRANSEVSRFIAASSATASRLMRQEKVARDRIDIIPSGIDWQKIPARTAETTVDAKHSFGLSVHQPVILMSAPFVPTSDYATFLRAAANLAPHHPNARYVLLGEGENASIAGVKKLADELRVSDSLVFVHDLAMQNRWTQAADVGVQASLLESSADTLLTFMAAGLPVVATQAGGNAEIIHHGHSGYLIDPLDADALAMRIHILLVAENVAEEFTAAARNRVRTDFDSQRELQNFSAYYRTLAYTTSAHWRRSAGSSLAGS
jgi:glycosyltransferase involved in cell wall biosynthesis